MLVGRTSFEVCTAAMRLRMEDCCETDLTWNQELSDYTVECSRISCLL